MTMALIGLFIIALAWIIQAVLLFEQPKTIAPAFVILYLIGVSSLVVDGVFAKNWALVGLNFFSGVGALAVLVFIWKK